MTFFTKFECLFHYSDPKETDYEKFARNRALFRGYLAWDQIWGLRQTSSSRILCLMKLTRVQEAIQILTVSAEELLIQENPKARKSALAVRTKKTPTKAVRTKKTPAKAVRTKRVVTKPKRSK